MKCNLTAIITTLTLGLCLAPIAGAAQPATHVPRVGFLDSGQPGLATAFAHGLQALGYVEGEDVILEWRSWEGRPERALDLIAELVHRKVDVLVVAGSRIVKAAQQATTSIPIVMVAGGDPVEQGFIASLARPGGNITGLTVQHPELHAKTLELLKETLPQLSRVALLWEAGNSAGRREVEKAAGALGVHLHILEVHSPDELPRAFEAAIAGRAEALYVRDSAMISVHLAPIVEFAIMRRLPSLGQLRPSAEAGLLMSYGSDIADLFRRTATYVDKVLKGAKPGELPVEQPAKFELVINLKTARALGLTLSPSLLLQATEVIQ